MEIRQLRHFAAIADARSFSQAARHLNLTQQAVSKSVFQLEGRLGLKLLDRDRRQVGLTEYGRLLLPYARTILAEVQRFNDVLADATGRGFGQLKVGATPTLLDDLVPNTLRLFHDRNPRARVSVERGDFARLRDLMLQGELDIILSTAPDETPGHLIAVEVIGNDRNAIVVGAGHALADRSDITAADLSRYPYLATQNYRKGDAYLARLFGAVEHPVPRPALKTSSLAFATSWVQQGNHWWITPRRQVARALRAGSLVEIAVAPRDDSWPLVLATRRHATRSPAAAAYAEIIRAYVRTDDWSIDDV